MLQIGDKSDSVSVDRLKPVYFTVTVDPAVPPSRGRPWLVPPAVSVPPDPVLPPKMKVWFSPLALAMQLRRNPHRTVGGSPPLSAVLRPHLLGEVTVATRMTCLQPPYYRAVPNPHRH